MAQHPIEVAVVNATQVNKAPFREEIKQYVREFGSVALFRTYDLINTPNALIGGVFYRYDSLDLITADNGTTCVHDLSARRFKKQTLAVAGSTVFTASSVAGTNTITATTDGLLVPSVTPQYVMFTPANNITGPASITFDAWPTLNFNSPLGNALNSDEVVAGIPYMLRVTSTDIRIQFSGATW